MTRACSQSFLQHHAAAVAAAVAAEIVLGMRPAFTGNLVGAFGPGLTGDVVEAIGPDGVGQLVEVSSLQLVQGVGTMTAGRPALFGAGCG
jgi:hypothetical protein